MTFEEARSHILQAFNHTSSILSETRFASQLADPGQDIALSELGLDSLAAMEICMKIEDETGVEIDLGDLAIYSSINALARHLAAKAAGK